MRTFIIKLRFTMMMMSGSDENMNVDGNILLLYSAVQLTEVKVHNFFARG